MRRPGALSLWFVVGCGAALQVGLQRLWDPPPDPSREWTAPQHEPQQRLARKAVDAVVAEIGGDLRIDEVEVVPLPVQHFGRYERRHRRIAINSRSEFDAQRLLAMAAHECVHALFHQETLPLPGDGVVHLRVEEATAEVLGAMLAGRVWSRRGGDGDALTRRLLEEYRALCDPRSPTSMRRKVERAYAAFGEETFDPEKVDDVAAHFPDLDDVDRVIGICRAHPDPRTAIRGVHRAFFGEWSDDDLFALRFFGRLPPTPTPDAAPPSASAWQEAPGTHG